MCDGIGRGPRAPGGRPAEREFACDLALVGIGITRNTALAEAAGLKVDNGIMVNERLQTSEVSRYQVKVEGEDILVAKT